MCAGPAPADPTVMRRRPVAVILAAALVSTPSAAAATGANPSSARDVRAAIPAVEAYRADHGTYAGMTLVKLRKYDRTVRRVAIRRATRSRYCLQSTAAPIVHFDGPRGPVRRGRCGVKGTVVPPPPPSPPPPPPSSEAAPAQKRLRNAAILFLAFYTDNGTYAGATIEKLRRYDPSLRNVTIAWTKPSRFCIETPAGNRVYHLLGPAEPPKPGRCPATGG
jgi:hypothetical protein